MKGRLARVLVVVLIAGGAAWWFWPAGLGPWRIIARERTPRSIQFTPDGRSLVAVDRGVTVASVARTGPTSPGRTLPASLVPCPSSLHPDEPDGFWTMISWLDPVRVSPDGRTVATTDRGRDESSPDSIDAIRLLDLETGRLRFPLPLPADERINDLLSDVVFADHGRIVRVVKDTEAPHHSVMNWDAATGVRLPDITIPGPGGYSHEFIDDGMGLIFRDLGGSRLTVYDLRTNQPRAVFRLPQDPGTPMTPRWSAPPDLVFSYGIDNTLCRIKPIRFDDVSASADGRVLATTATDHAVQFWDVPNRRLLAEHVPTDCDPWVVGVEVAPDGRAIAVLEPDNSVRLWDVERRCDIVTIPCEHDRRRARFRFAPDGRTVVVVDFPRSSSTAIGQVRDFLSDVLTARGVPNPLPRPGAKAPDQDRVRLFDVATGKQLALFGGPPQEVAQTVFSPDSRTLAIHGRLIELNGTTYTRRPVTSLWDVPGHR